VRLTSMHLMYNPLIDESCAAALLGIVQEAELGMTLHL